MGLLNDLFGGMFSSSNTVRKVPIYTLRKQIVQWTKYKSYPTYYELPPAIQFPSEFWTRVKEIHRHTTGDKHERAITVWWADGEFVLTDSVRGKQQEVLIPKQKISVKYQPQKGTKWVRRIITVNGKVYSKNSVLTEDLRKIKQIEVQFLFNMHTHPPHESAEKGTYYSFFSEVDVRSFLTSNAFMTGLVTDKLWLMAKTNLTPASVPAEIKEPLTPERLTNYAKVKVYCAQEFGRSAVVVRPDDEEFPD